MKTTVCKLSESGKTILVGHKSNKYAIGYTFAWCANPDNLKVGDEVKDFSPIGREGCVDAEGNPLIHSDGSPVMRWIF